MTRRRTFLGAAGTSIVTLLAGCAGTDGTGAGTETATETATTSPTATRTATASPTSTEGSDDGYGSGDDGYGGSDDGYGGGDDTETGTETQTDTDSPTATESDTATDTPTDTATRTPTATATPTRVVVNNVGASAWEVTTDTAVAANGTENPTLTLQVGTRYVFENRGWSAHPLAFRGGGSALLSQDGDGSYESDAAVDWRDDGDEVAFTLTSSLADDLDTYVCTVHGGMRGDVTTEG